MCQLLSVVVRRLERRGRPCPPDTGPLAASNLQNDLASSVCAEKVYVNQQKSFGETDKTRDTSKTSRMRLRELRFPGHAQCLGGRYAR